MSEFCRGVSPREGAALRHKSRPQSQVGNPQQREGVQHNSAAHAKLGLSNADAALDWASLRWATATKLRLQPRTAKEDRIRGRECSDMMQWAALHAQELGPLSQLDIVTQAEKLTRYASAAAAAAMVALLSVQVGIPPLLLPSTRVHNQSMAHIVCPYELPWDFHIGCQIAEHLAQDPLEWCRLRASRCCAWTCGRFRTCRA